MFICKFSSPHKQTKSSTWRMNVIFNRQLWHVQYHTVTVHTYTYCLFSIFLLSVMSLSFCLCCGSFCHHDKFLACVNIIGNTSHSHSDSVTVIYDVPRQKEDYIILYYLHKTAFTIHIWLYKNIYTDHHSVSSIYFRHCHFKDSFQLFN